MEKKAFTKIITITILILFIQSASGTSVIPSDKIIPLPEGLFSEQPSLTANEAKIRAENLFNVTQKEGNQLNFSKMPTLKLALKSIEYTERDLEAFLKLRQYHNITLQNQTIGISIHPIYHELIVELEGTVIFDVNANGRLEGNDAVFFVTNNQYKWFFPTTENRTKNPETTELAEWLYQKVILSSNLESKLGIHDVLTYGFGHITLPEQKVASQQWANYLSIIQTYHLPLKTIEPTHKSILLSQTKSNPRYNPYTNTIFLTPDFFNKDELKCSLTNNQISQIYCKFVEAYYDKFTQHVTTKNDRGYSMHELIHGIINELLGITEEEDELKEEIEPAVMKELELARTEDIILTITMRLSEFHYEFSENEIYFTDTGNLTDEGQNKFQKSIPKTIILTEENNQTTIHITDYAINRILEAIGSKHRIVSEEAKEPIYIKQVSIIPNLKP